MVVGVRGHRAVVDVELSPEPDGVVRGLLREGQRSILYQFVGFDGGGGVSD